MRIILKVFLPALFLLPSGIVAQFAPPVGQAGTTAIYKDSSCIADWAGACRVVRGYMDISNPSAGYAGVGDSTMALGPAGSNGVVSLGDGGSATLQFAWPIRDGAGPDLAVFENGFDDTFLELAFVEASSDGIHFFRFPAVSNTDTTTQTAGFGATDATRIHNLAGKYRALYGTPFDLADIPDDPLLDKQSVTHIRVIDVIGSIEPAYGSRDKNHHLVNDPWPTAFASGGFDLDAVAVIHNASNTGISESANQSVRVFPNPAHDVVNIRIAMTDKTSLRLESTDGTTWLQTVFEGGYYRLNMESLPPGVYVLSLTASGFTGHSRLVKE